MRAYPEASEEALRAREFLKEWKNDGNISEEQYAQLEQETPCDLRTTNIFLRLVLLFFTIVAVAAVVGLFFIGGHSESTAGVTFLVFAVFAYLAAEAAVSKAHLYRFGIEEALAVCSVALLYLGIEATFLVLRGAHANTQAFPFLAPAAGAASSLWIWRRLGLWYAFPAAMIFAVFLPFTWTSSHTAQRCLICLLYAIALACVAAVRSRHRFDFLAGEYSLAEAFLWLGIYLVLNLKLSAINAPSELWSGTQLPSEFANIFYWSTWVLLWCLPPVILQRGFRQRDRFLIAVGMLTAVLTLVTNKLYLGWQRHTWDPMLLGIALIAVAVFLRRWLAQGPNGVRHGYTGESISARHKKALGVASSVLGLIAPHAVTPPPQQHDPSFDSGFGGGSGGAGSSGDF